MSEILRCSFCDKTVASVAKIISAPRGYPAICNECVRICADILDETVEGTVTRMPPRRMLPMWLLRMFGGDLR